MDLPKALGILGFEDTQWLLKPETSPKEELVNAHNKKMKTLIEKKKEEARESNNTKKKKKKKYRYSRRRKQMTADDEFRILHEAYQFLLKKFNLGQDLTMDDSIMKIDQSVNSEDSDSSEGIFDYIQT